MHFAMGCHNMSKDLQDHVISAASRDIHTVLSRHAFITSCAHMKGACWPMEATVHPSETSVLLWHSVSHKQWCLQTCVVVTLTG